MCFFHIFKGVKKKKKAEQIKYFVIAKPMHLDESKGIFFPRFPFNH